MSELNENPTPQRPVRKAPQLPSTRKILGLAFGIFMVFIYVGMGVLLMQGFFGTTGVMSWMRWFVGVLLVLYGCFRGYRQYKDFTDTDSE